MTWASMQLQESLLMIERMRSRSGGRSSFRAQFPPFQGCLRVISLSLSPEGLKVAGGLVHYY
jgi:hypothetical protein